METQLSSDRYLRGRKFYSEPVFVVLVIVVSTKIAESRKTGVGQSALCHQTVESHEKLSHICFKSLRMAQERYKSYVFAGAATGHAYRPHLPMLCAVSTVHAASQNR